MRKKTKYELYLNKGLYTNFLCKSSLALQPIERNKAKLNIKKRYYKNKFFILFFNLIFFFILI